LQDLVKLEVIKLFFELGFTNLLAWRGTKIVPELLFFGLLSVDSLGVGDSNLYNFGQRWSRHLNLLAFLFFNMDIL
jgi:hypothetical protein